MGRSIASGSDSRPHVLDIEQYLLAPLMVPRLPARIFRVHQDCPDSELRPCPVIPVTVASRVVRAGGGDAFSRELLSDAVETVPLMYSAKIRLTVGAAVGSISSRWSRLTSAALPGFGCAPASASLLGCCPLSFQTSRLQRHATAGRESSVHHVRTARFVVRH
jgi:hypothetical protein